MITIVSSFTWSDPSAAAELAEQMARETRRLPTLTPRRDVQTLHLTCFALERPGSASPVGTWRGENGSSCLVTQRKMEGVVRERLRAILDDLPVAFPHQLALHLDLVGRQRRHVAAQPNLMARVVDAILFFYTRAQFAFWVNLPYEDLRFQRLYLAYAGRRFPRLFPPTRQPSIPGRVIGAARNSVAYRFPALRSWLAPMEIDSSRHVAENRTHFARLADESIPLVGQWFRLPALLHALASVAGTRVITPTQALRLANLLLVLQAGDPRGSAPGAPGGG